MRLSLLLMEKIAKYEEAKSCKFYIRDSRTIDGAKGRVKKSLNCDLEYYELSLCCIHGGKKPREHGQRASL